METNQHTDHQAIFESFLAARRDKHGDLRMEDPGSGETPPEGASTETPPGEETPPPGEETPPADTRTDEEKAIDELPEWARNELKKVRGEAANYRTRLRDAEAKLSEAKTPEDIEAAVAEIRVQNAKLERSLLVTKVATKHQLPEALAARLQGDDEAALEADAAALAALVSQSSPESLSGGLTPGGESDEAFDPVAAAQAARRNRY